MNNKTLRILIVEAQHLEQLFLEKVMNSLGYYRVAPMASVAEAMIAIRDAVVPFDLLIINAEQECCDDFDLLSYCKSAEQLRHSIVYGCNVAQDLPQSFQRGGSVHMTANHRLDVQILKKLMMLVDPPTQYPARKAPTARALRSSVRVLTSAEHKSLT
ncbi:hypothetical protein BLX41_04775 [Pseudomonas protegens]|uniref:hypothetical protein n=1 Tax=Pseudomonas protegens TaxID=380021 RepID=UPI000F4B48D7|nr:hypothetical protein [Pseudomonas protegens]ROL81467.1 hypothetical protein BLX41_04775 [Pseudomonas protegens]